MKGIHTLITLHQRELDGLRRQHVQLEEQKEKLIQLAAKLHNELMKERELAVKDPTMAAYMGDFEKRIKNRQMEIAKEVIQLDQRIAQLLAAITESFGELKKYEITRDNALEREKAKVDQQEQEMLDEVGIQQFSRKDDTNK